MAAVKAAISKYTSIDKKLVDEHKNSALKQIIDNAIIGLLSPEFLEDVKNLQQKNLAVELLEKLLRDEVKARMKTDVVSEKLYSEAVSSGLNHDEIAFYRAIVQNESAVRELGDNALKELAKYVTEQLRKSTTVDWQVRDSVRAWLRNLVRRALRKWKYPPDKADEAVELCLKQAEALSQSWSV